MQVVAQYCAGSVRQRDVFWFRGMGSDRWELKPTLDRPQEVGDHADRRIIEQRLLNGFLGEALRTGHGGILPHRGVALELLARHHGVPSPILDWTKSPYVAAFFALSSQAVDSDCEYAAVYVLDRRKLPDSEPDMEDPVLLIDDTDEIRVNPRAVLQRGVFMKYVVAPRDAIVYLKPALSRFLIPRAERTIAISQLDEMLITKTTLFGDLDGAAATASVREGFTQ